MKVLFADGEQRVLEAIERSLALLDLDWTASFVRSSTEALARLEQESFDVLVSDVRLTDMGGVNLFAQACQRFPHVARIVLSSQGDETAALAVVRVAHQFLAKPCSPEALRRVIERTHQQKNLLNDPNLRALVGGVERLPSPPRLFTELLKLLDDEKAQLEDVTRVVRQDPAMASKLLQIANSAWFSARREVTDLKGAVTRLGLTTLRNLALGVGAFDAVSTTLPHDRQWVEQLQERALRVARLAGGIMGGRGQAANEAFLGGLLCNLGLLVLATVSRERFLFAQSEASRLGRPIHEVEQSSWGCTHAEVGAALLGLWGLPFGVVEAVLNHHFPERNVRDVLGAPQAVWIAAAVVEDQSLDPAYLDAIGATDAVEKCRRALQ